MEESAPVDSDMKREAEVIQQVRDTEPETSPTLSAFPSLQPPPDGAAPDVDPTPTYAKAREASSSFGRQASRNSGGVEFWNSFDERYHTPPPLRQTGPSSVADDDMFMDITPSTTIGSTADSKARSRSSTPHPPGMAIGEIRRKRRREDDFDPNLFKRRAVSPSVSAQSSPVLTHSSVVDTGPSTWGPPSKLGPPFSERPSTSSDNGNGGNNNGNGNNNRTTPHTGGTKRVGLQGMTEASDGFMNMSIE
jgi:hypothetical protein